MDEQLRMRASVTDGATATLRKIRAALLDVSRPGTLDGLSKGVKAVRVESGQLGREVSTVLTPALARFGLGAGGFVAAMTAIGSQVRTFSREMVDLKFQARGLGVSTKELEAFNHAAAKLRISPDAAGEGLSAFKRNAEDFQLRIGGLRDELRRLGAGDVVNAIMQAKTPTDQLRIAFERMEAIKARSPASAKRFAEAMFGSAKFARMSWKEVEAAMREVNSPTEDQLKIAEEINLAWVNLDRRATELSRSITFAMVPGFRDLAKAMEDIDPKDIETIGKSLGAVISFGAENAADVLRKLSANLREVMDIYKTYKEEGIGAAIGKALSNPGGPSPFGDVTGGFRPPTMDERSAIQQRRVEEAQRRIRDLDSQIGGMGEGTVRKRMEERRENEIKLLKELEEGLRKLNEEVNRTGDVLKKGTMGWGGGAFVPTAYSPGGGGGPMGGARRPGAGPFGGAGYQAIPDFDAERPKADAPMGADAANSAGRAAAAGAAGAGGEPYKAVKGGSRTAIAMRAAVDQLRRLGVPEANVKHAAASLTGQAIVESGLNPRAVHDGGTGYGIYGARDPGGRARGRRTEMFKWLAANGFSKDSLEGQMRYMATEAMTRKEYSASRRALMGASADNMHGVADVLTKNFERPADQGARQVGSRYYASRGALQQYNALPIDQANNPTMKAEGTVNVNVHAPKGTRVSAESDGSLFQSTELHRHRQMEPAQLGPMDVQ